MDFRDILLLLHIAGAGTWLGANVVQAVAPTMAAKQSVAAAAGWYRVAAQLSKKLYMPAAILILLTGIGLVLQTQAFGFGTLFVTVGYGMIVVGALFGILIFEPGSERAAAALKAGDEGATKEAAGRIATFGTIDTLLLLFTMAVMVLRLGV